MDTSYYVIYMYLHLMYVLFIKFFLLLIYLLLCIFREKFITNRAQSLTNCILKLVIFQREHNYRHSTKPDFHLHFCRIFTLTGHFVIKSFHKIDLLTIIKCNNLNENQMVALFVCYHFLFGKNLFLFCIFISAQIYINI